MNAVDQGDQSRMHGGGWANKGHFKKWYKKAFHGVLDIMLLQSWIAWRLAVAELCSEIGKCSRATTYTLPQNACEMSSTWHGGALHERARSKDNLAAWV
jgi:hypothetical protein